MKMPWHCWHKKVNCLWIIFPLAVTNATLISCSKNEEISLTSTNNTLVSGMAEYSKTTINVKSKDKINNLNWSSSISSDLPQINDWTKYLTISSQDDNHCTIQFVDSPEDFSDFHLFVKIIISNQRQSNQLTILVKQGEPLDSLFAYKTFDFANIGIPTERFFARSAFAFNLNTPNDITVSDLITPTWGPGNTSMTYTSDISKYFDTTTFNVNLRGNDSVMFSLSKIIPPNFHDFTNLDWTQCVPLPLNKDDWTSNDWLDLQFDFEANFRYFIPGWTDGFDNYFQQIHWDHIQIDNIDSSARNLTLKGDGINYYTDDLLTFTGVEFK